MMWQSKNYTLALALINQFITPKLIVMKRSIILIGGVIILTSFSTSQPDTLDIVNNESFQTGEEIEFKMSFGVFTIGKAKMKIHPTIHNVNYRGCYKVDIWGKTSGMVDWVSRVDDNWGAYVDTLSLVPHISYRKIKEGSYRKNELVKFDHTTNNIEVKTVDKETGKFKEPMYYASPMENVRSMISGMMYLRTVDFEAMAVGDTLTMSGFFEDEFYDLDIIYKGKGKVKTKAGKFNAIKLVPIVPNNKLFDGENSVTAWISDDKNRLPLKVEADMFIGNAGVEIINYKGVKNPLNFYKKE